VTKKKFFEAFVGGLKSTDSPGFAERKSYLPAWRKGAKKIRSSRLIFGKDSLSAQIPAWNIENLRLLANLQIDRETASVVDTACNFAFLRTTGPLET